MPGPAHSQKRWQHKTLPGVSTLTLARWQLRTTWRLLLMISLGMLAALVLITTIPLYIQATETSSLRQTLSVSPEDAYIHVSAINEQFQNAVVNQIQQQLSHSITTNLSGIAQTRPVVSVEMPSMRFSFSNFIKPIGFDMSQLPAHTRLVKGRFPRQGNGTTIEFALTPDAAEQLGLQIGSVISSPFQLVQGQVHGNINIVMLTFRLTGTFTQLAANDPFWHTNVFQASEPSPDPTGTCMCALQALAVVPNTQLMGTLDSISHQYPNSTFMLQVFTNWYYTLDLSQLDIEHLNALVIGVQRVGRDISDHPIAPPFIQNTNAFGPLSALQDLNIQLNILNFSLQSLTYLIGGLLLLFILLGTELLIERQTEAMSLLRSRGASQLQVFGALLAQSIGISVLILLIAPWLALLLAIGLTSQILHDSTIVHLLSAQPWQVAGKVFQNTLGLVGLILLSMALATWRAMHTNVLTVRREATRTQQQSLWLRLKLDLLAATVALVSLLFLWYLNDARLLDIHTRVVILPAVTLATTLFLMLGGLVALLRCFPALLRLGSKFTQRRRGAVAMLTVAQMERAPRQPLRLVILLTLAITLVLFTITFTGTQNARASDQAAFQVGGDFSGLLSNSQGGKNERALRATYGRIPGVTSVTAGYTTLATSEPTEALVNLLAMDTSTYSQTVYWPDPASYGPLRGWLSEMAADSTQAEHTQFLPAVIDETAAQSLDLTPGKNFLLRDEQNNAELNFTVLGIVPYLPTVNDGIGLALPQDPLPVGGILVDFHAYSTVALFSLNHAFVSPTGVWLRASANPAQQASVRRALSNGDLALENLSDRLALAADAQRDPLYQALVGILLVSIAVALLLGLLGNLFAFWLGVRAHLTHFALLRALGCTPEQITRMLMYEQTILYLTALTLGTMCSLLFTWLALPGFVYSPVAVHIPGLTNNPNLPYLAQLVPPVHEFLPLLPLGAALLGIIAVCMLAVGAIGRFLAHLSLGHSLRLNED